MNPLVLLVVVVALVGGGLYVYRTYVSGPASKCSEINEAFDLISIVPPPELIAVPKALAGSSLAPVLLTSMSTAREAWGKAVATQNRSFAPGDPDAIGASWQSWVALKRATVLDEENC